MITKMATCRANAVRKIKDNLSRDVDKWKSKKDRKSKFLIK